MDTSWSVSLFLLSFLYDVTEGQFSPVKDDIMYNIQWHKAGTVLDDIQMPVGQLLNPEHSYKMTTASQERYTCTLPSPAEANDSDKRDVKPMHAPNLLLAPLFMDENCAYRVESYWTYEVCHAKHVRQYHDERIRSTGVDQTKQTITDGGGKIKIQPSSETNTLIRTVEYFLGHLDGTVNSKGVLESAPPAPQSPEEVPRKKINGMSRPYYAVNMTEGTPCDLKPGTYRKTTILYVCAQQAYNEVSSVIEVSTCEYEIVVPTPHLCANPLYRIEGKQINQIQCIADEDSPPRPNTLAEQERDLTITDTQSILKQVLDQAVVLADRSITQTMENGETATLKVSVKKMSARDRELLDQHRNREENKKMPGIDNQMIKDFLKGQYCIPGGTGWWKFELCYGKHVHQYHDDPKTGRTSIVLGKWDEANHREWARKTGKAFVWATLPGGIKKLHGIQQLYTGGDFCEEKGVERKVVVRMMCRNDVKSPSAVVIYIREPETCSYQLNVESGIFCSILEEEVDEDAVFKHN